jgi:hypothetical protein
MTAGIYTITIEQGSTFSLPLTWKDALGSLVNLTGYTARLYVREEVESPAPFITLTTENGGITLGGAAGTITLLMSATTTAALAQTKGVYDLELISGSGVVTRLLEGIVVIRKEVTR